MLKDYRSPWTDADLELFRDNVRRFVASEIAAHDAKWREQKYVDRSVWLAAGELGILLPDIPEAYGGAGGTFAWDAVVFEELGHAGDCAFGKAVHNIAAHYLLAARRYRDDLRATAESESAIVPIGRADAE